MEKQLQDEQDYISKYIASYFDKMIIEDVGILKSKMLDIRALFTVL